MIREDEPQIPSRRLSTLGDLSISVATQRRSDPRRLGASLKGELDWIVMKTLEKDRNRRYESAKALSEDRADYKSFVRETVNMDDIWHDNAPPPSRKS